jgi:integrase
MPRKLPNNIHIRCKADGRRVYRVLIRRRGVAPYSHEFAKLADALAARDARLGLLTRLRSGGTASTITVREAIESYRCGIWYRQLARAATMDVGLRYWDRQLGKMRFTDLSAPLLAAERERLVAEKRTGATVCAYLTALSQAWSWAQETMGAAPNLVTTIKWPRVKRPPPSKYTAAQIRHILQRADAYESWPALGLLVRLSLLSTQRKGNILSVKWSGVDFASGTVEIARTKNGEAFAFPVEGKTLELLRAQYEREAIAGRGGAMDYVFQSPKKRQPIECKKHVEWLFDDPELAELTFKHLRSTALSRLFTHAKLDLPRIKRISGHKTARILLERYAFADVEDARTALRQHGDMLLGVAL